MGKLKITKQDIWHWTLVFVGCVILGFATATFLTKNSIISGGLSGIGLIVQYLIDPEQTTMVVDIVVWAVSILLWFISLFFIGKQFAFKTLLATLLFPISLSVFLRVPFFVEISNAIAGVGDTGDLLICSIFGGLLAGLGIAITFIGKGSTGGVDVISFIINKYLGIKVNVTTLIIDMTIIIVGMFVLNFPHMIVNSLCGMICAFMMAMVIQIMYSRRENGVIMEVISTKHQEIKKYLLNDLGRGVTTYDVIGGYTGKDRVMLRSIFSNEEYLVVKDQIAVIDPEAFITFTQTHAVFGEGFKENIILSRKLGPHKKKEKNKENNGK